MAAMPSPSRRYQLKKIIGQGGMGVVYRAYDNETRRDVTLKTLLDSGSPEMLELFRKECEVLSRLNHPNIVDIYDVGELEVEGKRKPYFVMPLLPGITLDALISDASHRLTIDRVVDIIAQSCRGLQAAHERGLVHRDVKPSNIFVLADDSVKIIDFGVAHLAGGLTNTMVKGTLHYMSPEQVQAKKPTPASDIYSLGVVCYEALTRRRPFEGTTMEEVVEAILHQTPPAVSELNPSVSSLLSQVVHKAMAKQAFYRFASAREFGETLQKAARNERIEIFDEARMLSRIERCRKSLESGELEFASEVLAGLENEGYVTPEMPLLRRQIDHSNRERTIAQLLETSRRCFREEEYQIALQKIDDILRLDPVNAAALALQADIHRQRSSEQVSRWMALAQEHLKNHSYGHARQALEDVLQLHPDHTEAHKLLTLVETRQRDYVRFRKERDETYEAALAAWRRGEITSALTGMERVLELIKLAPDTTDSGRAAAFQQSYNQVRSDQDLLKAAYEQARRHLNDHNFKAALEVCDECLGKYPGNALFQSLKVDVEEARRQDLSAFVARIDREVENEPDLDRRLSILREAMSACPGESHFERALELTRTKRDLVASIVAKARAYEEKRQFTEALGQWEMLRTIYSRYPGIDFEIERVIKRRDNQARAETKARWVSSIDHALSQAEWDRAVETVNAALAEFPGDGELKALEQIATQRRARSEEAKSLLEESRTPLEAGDFDAALGLIRRALKLDEQDAKVRAALVDALLRQARALQESDPARAAELVTEALQLDPSDPLAKSLSTLLDERKRQESVDASLAEARQHQASGRLDEALATVDAAFAAWPGEPRLVQLRDSLQRLQTAQRMQAERRRDLESARELETTARQSNDRSQLSALLNQTMTMAGRYEGDRDFDSIVAFLRARLSASEPPPEPAAAVSAAVAPPSQPSTAAPPAPMPKPARAPIGEQIRLLLLDRAWRRRFVAGLVVVAVLAAIAAGSAWLRRRGQTATGLVALSVMTQPAGAEVAIDGKSRGSSPIEAQLSLGTHQVVVAKQGYNPVSLTWEVKPGFAPPLIDLVPTEARIQIVSEVADVQVGVDGGPPSSLAAGIPLPLGNQAYGKPHAIAFVGAAKRAGLSFTLKAGSQPEITLEALPDSAPTMVLATLGSSGRFYSSRKVTVGTGPEGPFVDADANGVTLEGLPETGSLVVRDTAATPWMMEFKTELGPSLFVMVASSAPVPAASLTIDSTESDFTILVDRRKVRAVRRGSGFAVPLAPGQRTIEFEKPGYTADPPKLSLEVKPEQKIRHRISWTGMPATVVISGAVPGTQVFANDRMVTTISGRDAREVTIPANAKLVLSAPEYESRVIKGPFGANSRVEVKPPESVLEPKSEFVVVELIQPKTGVTLEVVSQDKGITYTGRKRFQLPEPVKLPHGRYVLRLSAPGYVSEDVSIEPKYDAVRFSLELKRR